MSKGFDLSEQTQAASKEDEGTVVHIHGIDEKPLFYENDEGVSLPVTVTVAGAHSKVCRRFEQQLRKRKLKARQLTGEVIYDDNIEKVAACTLAWEGFFDKESPIRCDAHNAKMVYSRAPWVLEQVLEAMHEHTRFFGNGSTTPSPSSDSNLD